MMAGLLAYLQVRVVDQRGLGWPYHHSRRFRRFSLPYILIPARLASPRPHDGLRASAQIHIQSSSQRIEPTEVSPSRVPDQT